MFEVSYVKNYSGTVKKWRFSEDHEARAFYKAAVSSLKGIGTVIRLPGDGTAFYIRGEPRLDKSYRPGQKFYFSRDGKTIWLGWVNPDRKILTQRYREKYVPFERIFENSTDDVKKILAFHFDIFA